MPMNPAGGTEGDAESAGALFRSFERVDFVDVHRAILHLMPTRAARVLDIGSGSGRDAAAFAATGHRVVAVEPVAELRRMAAAAHGSPGIEWMDDSLPELTCLSSRSDRFDLVMITAVWMHLDTSQRTRAMPNVARLLGQGGTLIMSLRHGPPPPGRRTFEVTAEDTTALAAGEGLEPVLRLDDQPSAYARTDVTWTRLAFRASGGGA